jgi:hypothetical protein
MSVYRAASERFPLKRDLALAAGEGEVSELDQPVQSDAAKMELAPALAVLALLAVTIPNLELRQPTWVSVDATLSASRGIEAGALFPAHTGVRLRLAAIDLPAGGAQVERVDGGGTVSVVG